MLDVIVIGAGPAGLTAALWLGRCGRKTLVIDSGSPRNAASLGLHGFLTRDGVSPVELRQRGRDELSSYPSVEYAEGEVVNAVRGAQGFDVLLRDGVRTSSHLLLLATGRKDTLPDLPQAREFYGRGIYHCPYCDGWEHRGQPMGVLGTSDAGWEMAKLLRTWTNDLSLYTDAAESNVRDRSAGTVVVGRIVRLIGGADGRLAGLELQDGSSTECRALFFCSDCSQKSDLVSKLGCRLDGEGSVMCDGHAATNVPGLFVAGNVRGGVHLAIMAAAEGAEAALAMNKALL